MTESPTNPQNNKNFVVDLDGTLIKNDLLFEALTDILCRNPLHIFKILKWLKNGKAYLKEQIAKNYQLDVTTLPYNQSVIKLIESKIEQGYNIILATASHRIFAVQVANHLKLFDELFATQGKVNLRGETKRDLLIKKYGVRNFEYIGNSHDDLAVWQFASKVYAANPNLFLRKKLQSFRNLADVFINPQHPVKTYLKAIRIHQWVKNSLLFIPLIASHKNIDFPIIQTGLLAFLFFSLCASHVYLFNDVLDIRNDRNHRSKKHRAVAAGLIPSHIALALSFTLLLIAIVGSFAFLPFRFGLSVFGYYVLTLSYSVILKRIEILDIVTLAALYTMRIIAGTYAFSVSLTFWMLAFSMFIFLSLSLVKRYAELYQQRINGENKKVTGRGYYPSDLEIISAMGTASGYLSVMVLALYIQDDVTISLYSHPKMIWFACPILLYWISRIWILTHRGEMNEDPVVFAIKDKISWIACFLFAVIFACAL